MTLENGSVSRLRKISVLLFIGFMVGNTAYAACTVSVTPLNFGIYDVLDTVPVESSGTIFIACDTTPPVDVMVTIDRSLNSGTFDPRQMKNASDAYVLNYNVYTDNGKRNIWGDGTAGTDFVTTKGTKQRKLTFYGSIPPLQNGTVGLYTDTLTVTITQTSRASSELSSKVRK